jgi:hypothetical protein
VSDKSGVDGFSKNICVFQKFLGVLFIILIWGDGRKKVLKKSKWVKMSKIIKYCGIEKESTE